MDLTPAEKAVLIEALQDYNKAQRKMASEMVGSLYPSIIADKLTCVHTVLTKLIKL